MNAHIHFFLHSLPSSMEPLIYVTSVPLKPFEHLYLQTNVLAAVRI